jgi:hypothetical protein
MNEYEPQRLSTICARKFAVQEEFKKARLLGTPYLLGAQPFHSPKWRNFS